MKLEVFDNHSVVVDLLTKRPVLDAGCRGFAFSLALASRGCPIVALDPDPSVTIPYALYNTPTWHHFIRSALVGECHPRMARLRMTTDAEARYVTHAQQEGDPLISCVTLSDLMKRVGVDQWDIIKLNVEGSEYDILSDIRGPVSRQIVVSFHEHTPQGRGDGAVAAIVEHLRQWYAVVQHEKEPRYCCPANWWDSVFVLKELA